MEGLIFGILRYVPELTPLHLIYLVEISCQDFERGG